MSQNHSYCNGPALLNRFALSAGLASATTTISPLQTSSRPTSTWLYIIYHTYFPSNIIRNSATSHILISLIILFPQLLMAYIFQNILPNNRTLSPTAIILWKTVPQPALEPIISPPIVPLYYTHKGSWVLVVPHSHAREARVWCENTQTRLTKFWTGTT